MHVHTYRSLDGLITKMELRRAIQLGKIDAVAITDHNKTSAWKEFSSLSIIQGIEKTVIQGNEKFDLLVYFVNEDIKSNDFYEIIDAAKEQDAITSIAHPFDMLRKAPKDIDDFSPYVNALECFNSRADMPKNIMAEKYADVHGLCKTAGSDAHHHSEIGNAYVEADATDLEEFRKLLLNKEVKLYGIISSFYVHFYSMLRRKGILKPRL